MTAPKFDPYHEWLGIPTSEQPPNHYRLLGLPVFEESPTVIGNAADQRMAHLRTFQTGKHAVESQRLLNEVAAARVCLLNPEKKAAYDQTLQAKLTPPGPPESKSPPVMQMMESPVDVVPDVEFPRTHKKHKKPTPAWMPWLFPLLGLAVAILVVMLIARSGRDQQEIAKAPAAATRSSSTPAKIEPTNAEPTPKPTPKSQSAPEAPLAPNVELKPKPAKPNLTLLEDPKPLPEVEPVKVDPQLELKPERPTPPAQPESEPETRQARLPVPDAPAQQKSLAAVQDIYKEDYKNDKASLAAKLLQKAKETQDATERFVLLLEAKDVAADIWQGELAFEAVDAMEREYDISGPEMKAGVLEQAAKKPRLTPEQKTAIARAALQVVDEAVSEGNFDVAKKLGRQATQLAHLLKNKELVREVVAKGKQVGAAAKASADAQEAMATLKEKPDDPEANLIAGRYQCFNKGDWDRGLPMLAKGSDENVKALAIEELGSNPTKAEEQVARGDAWWDLAEKADGKAKAAMRRRAAYWYQEAIPNLATGLGRLKAEKRLAQAADEPSPEAGSGAAHIRPPLAVAPFDEKIAKQHQTLWAKYLGVPVVQTNSIGMKVVLIPPGEFIMGSTKELIEEELRLHGNNGWYRYHLSGEGPQHRVRITKPYWLGVTEVTQEEYQRVMNSNPSKFQGDPKRPVEQVSWDDAVEFCRRLSELPGEQAAKRQYGLPTEAQWEYACRAGSTGRFCFSPQRNPVPIVVEETILGEYGWVIANAGGQTHPVARKRANVWGLYDIYGNVSEWCQDWYDSGYYAKSPTDDPQGPSGGSTRVHRGSWRSAFRGSHEPAFRFQDLGLRVARTPVIGHGGSTVAQMPEASSDGIVPITATGTASEKVGVRNRASNGVDSPSPSSKVMPAIIDVRTESWKNSTVNFARYSRLMFEVGMGNRGDGYGQAGIEIANTPRLTVAVEASSGFQYHDKNSFAGFVIDYHTNTGYTKRVGLGLGFSDKGRWDSSPSWGTNSKPNDVLDLGMQPTYNLNLQEWAPQGWDGKIWFAVMIENAGEGKYVRARIVSPTAKRWRVVAR